MYYVYLIKCQNKRTNKITYYCGYTKDPIQRMDAHCNGHGATHTKIHNPLEMRVISQFDSRSNAMKYEFAIKKRDKKTKKKLFMGSNQKVKK